MTEPDLAQRLEQARALTAGNQPGAAMRVYQEVLAADPKNPAARLLLGILLASEERWTEATEALQAVLEVCPDHEDAHLMLAEVWARQGDADRAEAQLGRLVAQQPQQARGWFSLGTLQGRRGRVSEAIQALERAIELDPRRLDTLFWLADARLKSGQAAEASELFRRVLKLNPHHLDARSGLGAALMQRGEMAAAARELQRVLQDDPTRTHILLMQIEAQRDLGNLKAAEAGARQAAAVEDARTDGLYLLGTILHRQGRLDDALATLREALERQPTADVHAELGRLYGTLERWEESVQHLQEAVRQCPDNCRAHYNLGLALQESGRVRPALLAWRRATELDPNYPEPWFAMGFASEAAGRMSEARTHYARYLKLAPRTPVAAQLRRRFPDLTAEGVP